jgi:monovalent cation/hydrogen antiporter
VVVGSVLAGFPLAWPISRLIGYVTDAPSSVILQFASTFAVWLAAEHLGLSGVMTIVVFAVTFAHRCGPLQSGAAISWLR